MTKIVLVFSLFTILFSCERRGYLSANMYDIASDNWLLGDTIIHKISVDDTSKIYQLSLYTATVSKDVSEIDIEFCIAKDSVITDNDTVKVFLSDKSLIDLVSDQRSIINIVLDSLRFNEEGDYLFKFRPIESVSLVSIGVLMKEKINK